MIESVPWSTSFREGDPYAELAGLVFFGSGPFTMAPGDSVRMAVEVSCAIGSTQLFALHDYIKSVYANNLQFPSPRSNQLSRQPRRREAYCCAGMMRPSIRSIRVSLILSANPSPATGSTGLPASGRRS